MNILVDSDILIEVSLGRDAVVVRRWMELIESDVRVLCSPVSVAELWHGARPSEHQVLRALFAAMQCPPIDADAGRMAGELMGRYSKGHGVELGDAMIASAAIMNGAALWTRNRKHYPMGGIEFY